MKNAALMLAACAALGFSAPVPAAGDATRGAKLHEYCLGCHATELYVLPRAKVKTLSALKKEVGRWNDRMNPKFTRQEIEDLVAYLNRDFYKLSQ